MVHWVTSGTQQKIFPIMTECEFRGEEENKKHKRDSRKLERTLRGRCEIEKRRGGSRRVWVLLADASSLPQADGQGGRILNPSTSLVWVFSPLSRFTLTTIFTDRRLCIRRTELSGRERAEPPSHHHHDQIACPPLPLVPEDQLSSETMPSGGASYLENFPITDHAVLIRSQTHVSRLTGHLCSKAAPINKTPIPHVIMRCAQPGRRDA